MSLDPATDYRALDRLYAVQSEERQERRGLETRATASIAAALASVAFTLNAVSTQLSGAHALEIVLLSIGAVLVFGGVLLCTSALAGGSSRTLAAARGISATLAALNVRLDPIGLKLVASPDLDRARIDVEDAVRVVQARFSGTPAPKGADVQALGSALQTASRLLRQLSGASLLAMSLTPTIEQPSTASVRPPDPSADRSESLREPEEMELALERAELEARRIRDGNIASVIVLQASSGLIALGVLLLVGGAVVLLA